MTGIKRVSDILHSFKYLREQGIDAVLCMVGDGPDRSPAEQQAKTLGIAKHVVWTGYQSDVAPYYALFLVAPATNLFEIWWDGRHQRRLRSQTPEAAVAAPGARTGSRLEGDTRLPAKKS